MSMSESQEDLFFSDLLKQFRRRKKLTQQQVAEQIGASREAVSLWERGHFKPETTTMVHELARVLDLDDEEKRLLFEALLGTASILPLHNFPDHNPYFTGREETLSVLHAHLTAGNQVALTQTQAISGLGGIGKTQVAIEYAYRFREYYHDILWVTAESRETLLTSYLTLARLLRLREREEREQHKVVEAVKRWFREHTGWLLILDNLEDLGLVREFVPAPRQGTVVLTTRRGETQPVAQPLSLDILSEEEGGLFLLKRAGYLPQEADFEMASVHDRVVAKAIVQAVGGLPLALDQAGAYLAETKRGLSDYLDLFEQRQSALLARRGTLAHDHPLSVTATFALAFEQTQRKNEAASDLLTVCAFLVPDSIPLEVLAEGTAYLGTLLEPVVVDALQLDQALETLQVYSLVQRNGEHRTLSIHRLVQAVLLDAMTEPERNQWLQRVIAALDAVFPEVEHATWNRCERLLPHALLCLQATDTSQENLALASVALKVAQYMNDRGRYAEAEPFFQRTLSIREQQLGSEHADLASPLHGLAVIHARQGKYAEAEPFFQRTLSIREQTLGPEHPHVASTLNSLAFLYTEQGKYTEAEPLYLRALGIWKQQVGPERSQMAQTLNNLALLYFDQGKYAEAEPLFQRALHIQEQNLGPEHPDVGHPLNNLANLCFEQGKYEEAEPLYLRALSIWEQQLGPEHPQVTIPLNNLAEVYQLQGRYVEAEPLFQRALSIREQRLGPEHPHTAFPLNGLANLYRVQGSYTEAEPLYQRALHIREQALDPQHPDIAETLYGFAQLREKQGNCEEARTFYVRTLAVREQALGASHPKSTEARQRLITLLHALGEQEEAAQFETTQAES